MASSKAKHGKPIIPAQKATWRPRFIYRYFHEREHAQRLLDGSVYLSTLDYVRSEDHKRGDKGDATLAYKVTSLQSDTPAEDQVVMRSRLASMGVVVPTKEELAAQAEPTLHDDEGLTNVQVFASHPNAFLLCTSLLKDDVNLRRVFGEYCVQIADPTAFRLAVTEELQKVRHVVRFRFAPVTYRGRTFADTEANVGALGFASIGSLSDEKEARMMWVPATQHPPIQPVELHVPAISKLCSLVSKER